MACKGAHNLSLTPCTYKGMRPAEKPALRCWVDALNDQLLGRVFLLAGKDQT